LYRERNTNDRQDKLVAPDSMTEYMIRAYHDAPFSGHQGPERTLAKIRQQFYWKNQYKEVKDCCAKCESCARKKSGTQPKSAPLQTFNEIGDRNVTWSLAMLGPLPLSERGNRWVLTSTDPCTKFPMTVPLPDATSNTIALAFVDNIICLF